MSALIAGMVNPMQLDAVWPKMAPWIMQSMGGDVRPEAVQRIKESIVAGTHQLWGVATEGGEIMAAVVTEVAFVGCRRTLVIRHLGGSGLTRWLHALAIIERWAMLNEFEVVEIWGRPGWIKLLEPNGYRHSFHVLEKNVSREIH